MMNRRSLLSGASALLACVAVAPLARATEGCGGFRWNVDAEMALFQGPAIPLAAGREPSAVPLLEAGRLYELALAPQGDVALASPPGKSMPVDGAHAGMVRLRVPAAGRYRVAQDRHFWVDALQEGKLLPALDFQGSVGCTPQKIVIYELAVGTDLLVQLSGGPQAVVRLSLTPAT